MIYPNKEPNKEEEEEDKQGAARLFRPDKHDDTMLSRHILLPIPFLRHLRHLGTTAPRTPPQKT